MENKSNALQPVNGYINCAIYTMEHYSVIKQYINMDKSLDSKDCLLYDFIYKTIWKGKRCKKGVGLRWLEEYDYRAAQENLQGDETLL